MIRLLDHALAVANNLSPDAIDDIVRIILSLAGNDRDTSPEVLSADERSAIAMSKAAVARGEFASDEQVRAAWAKHGL